MTYVSAFQTGNLIIPSALLFHFKDIFKESEPFLVWQFLHLQNTSERPEIAPSQIAESIGKSLSEVNHAISQLTQEGLLEVKTIENQGEIEVVFDTSPALARLDDVVSVPTIASFDTPLKELATTFEQELGRLLTPMEIEELTKILQEKTNPDVVKEALREAVRIGKANWKYIQAILRNWRNEGITSVLQIEEKRLERDNLNPSKVTVSEDFLQAMHLWRDDV